jgi:hypothetical protein
MLKRIGAEESGEFKVKASGTLPSGRPVVVNANGTVSTISGSPAAFGAQQEFEDAATENLSGTYDTTNDRIVFAYPDSGNSNNGKVVAGTVDSSSNTISFGTPVRVNNTFTSISSISVDFDTSNGKLLIVYVGNSKIQAKVGTVDPSDNSISLGSRVEIDSGSINMGPGACKYDPDTGKFLLVYNIDGGDSKGVVATVSGTSVSFGTKETWESSANTSQHQMVYDTGSNKFVVAFLFGGASLRCRVATISGTDVSFSNATFIRNAATSKHFGLAYDSTNNKIVAAYADPSNSNFGTAAIGTVTTTCSFSGATVFESATCQQVDAAFNPTTGNVDIAYKDNGNSQKGTFISATISSGSLTFSTAEAFTTGEANDFHLVHDPDSTKMIIGLRDHTTSQNGVAVVRQINTLNLTSENYIGMSRGVVSESALSIGATSVVNTGTNGGQAIAYDTNSDRVVIAYKDTSNGHGKAVVGTVSGSGITFGTPVTFNAATTTGLQPSHGIAFDSSNNKVVIVYKDNGNSNYGTAIVGTVDPSDNSISFGSEAVFESAHTTFPNVVFDSSNNKVLISYSDVGDSSKGKAIVGTVSGTSISFGSAAEFEGGDVNHETLNATFDSANNKVVIAYSDRDDSNKGKAVVATISGTSVSFGTPVEFTANDFFHSSITFDSTSNKVIIIFPDQGNSQFGTARTGTVSGTSISFGTAAVWHSGSAQRTSISYSPTADKSIVFFRDGAASDIGKLVELTVSGTSITASSIQQFSATTTSASSSVFDPDNNVIVNAYIDEGNTTDLETVQVTGTTINRSQVADGGKVSIDIIGSVSDNQLNLTAGQQYFVQTDGTIGETADSPSVLAGTAISATELLVKT